MSEPIHQQRSLDEIEAELTELAAHVSAATHRMLCLIRELDEREAWAQWGARSCAHYLSWRIGLDLATAREKVRVAHALARLPLTSTALGEARISYSKARAISRVATAANEDDFLTVALHGTASHVERVVRAYRGAERAAKEPRQAEEEHEARWLQVHYDEDGMLVFQGRLPPEQGALFLKALDAAREKLFAERRQEARDADLGAAATPSQGGASAETSACACVASSAGYASAEAPGPGGVMAGAGYASAEVPGPGGVMAGAGYASAEAPRPGGAVAGAGDVSAEASGSWDVASHAGEAADNAGGASRPWVAGASYSVAGPAVPREVALAGPQQRADALVAMAEAALTGGLGAASGRTAHEVVVHVDAAVLVDASQAGRCDVEDGPALAAEAARRLSCDAALVLMQHGEDGAVLDVGRRRRSVPPGMRRALAARDGGCQFPGCGCTRFVHAHHIRHWADGGETKVDNLLELCPLHHRLVHEGGFSVERAGDGRVVFRNAGGGEVHGVPPSPPVLEPPLVSLREISRRQGLTLDGESGLPDWDGGQINRIGLDWFLASVMSDTTDPDAEGPVVVAV